MLRRALGAVLGQREGGLGNGASKLQVKSHIDLSQRKENTGVKVQL